MRFLASSLLLIALVAASPAMLNGYCRIPADTGLVKTPLMVAIWQGDLETVDRLVKSGSSLNALLPLDCHDGYKALLTTPLVHAIEAGAQSRFRLRIPEMIGFLLEHGADPNFYAQTTTPLHAAASLADLATIKVLLQHKVRLEDRDEGGETAFMLAAQREKGAAVIPALVAAGADIHAVNALGDNALMLAAWQHQLDIVKLLIGLGVDACAKNNSGETAIDMVKTNLNDDPGKQEMIALLKTKCGD
jgi:ankyrin repeat protein